MTVVRGQTLRTEPLHLRPPEVGLDDGRTVGVVVTEAVAHVGGYRRKHRRRGLLHDVRRRLGHYLVRTLDLLGFGHCLLARARAGGGPTLRCHDAAPPESPPSPPAPPLPAAPSM